MICQDYIFASLIVLLALIIVYQICENSKLIRENERLKNAKVGP